MRSLKAELKYMKKVVVLLWAITIFSATAVAQSAPTLTIVTETPGLPSELWYGAPPTGVRVKPIRLRPPGAASQYACVGAPNTQITIDDCDFFIQQNYIDFLRRFPESVCQPGEQSCGLAFYLPILNGCPPGENECMKYTRGALSANFFRSPEFQTKGVYVMNLYLVTIGQRPTTAAELQDASKVERPHYSEFMADMAAISSPNDRNGPDPAKKAALTQAFVQRSEIVTKYQSATTLVQFGNALAATAGVTLSSSTQNAIAAATTRAQVLQIVAESAEVNTKFYQPTFVTMEYFGYLRRDPENCHDPANYFGTGDPNACGFIYQNNRFKELLPQLGSDLTQNFMVRGFIESNDPAGYRPRF
jgi:hypothetical protein